MTDGRDDDDDDNDAIFRENFNVDRNYALF